MYQHDEHVKIVMIAFFSVSYVRCASVTYSEDNSVASNEPAKFNFLICVSVVDDLVRLMGK